MEETIIEAFMEARMIPVTRGTRHSVSKTDMRTLCRYLDDAAAFYRRHAESLKDKDRARLLRNMSNKLKSKTTQTSK